MAAGLEPLLARINMIVKRTVRNLDANPLTHLPGNASIMDELQSRIQSGGLFAVGYCDLDKFKVYNDKYGFEKGDEIIKATARVIIQAAKEAGGNACATKAQVFAVPMVVWLQLGDCGGLPPFQKIGLV